MAKTKHGKSWMQRHLQDPFVIKANKEGYRSRASFKLLELQEKNKLFQPGMVIVDLGAAPGGWSQVVAKGLNGKGRLIALDILPMGTLAGVEFIQGDFTTEAPLAALKASLGTQQVDWILSDMAPNFSGIRDIDQPKIMYLAELSWEFAGLHLKKGGGFLVKLFQGSGFEEYLKVIRQSFAKVTICKPQASRAESRELYVLARGYYNIGNAS